jgi:hypothetical protein
MYLKGGFMKKTYITIINDLTESDMRDIFSDAIDALGITGGSLIPPDMFNLREKVLQILFNKNGEQ